jgi:hypothetical protein
VRLEKPSKPEKWDLPADISLKSALQRAKEEAQSRFDGTLAGTAKLPDVLNKSGAKGRTGTMSLLAKPTPRHEMFLTCNTAVEMSASLHRALIDPKKGEGYCFVLSVVCCILDATATNAREPSSLSPLTSLFHRQLHPRQKKRSRVQPSSPHLPRRANHPARRSLLRNRTCRCRTWSCSRSSLSPRLRG